MSKYSFALVSTVLTLAVASPALAGWDRSRVFDPAFSRSYDRQLERAAERLGPQAVVRPRAAIATHGAAQPVGKPYFGANRDRAVESIDSPYDN